MDLKISNILENKMLSNVNMINYGNFRIGTLKRFMSTNESNNDG